MKTQLFGVLLLISAFTACHKERHQKDHSCGDCPKDQICTMDYRTLSLSVKNASGEPIALDSFRTKQNRTGLLVGNRFTNWEDSTFKANGNYPYWSDSFTDITKRHGEEVHFLGYKNGQEVLKQILFVGFDCCHVVAESGNTEVVLNLDK